MSSLIDDEESADDVSPLPETAEEEWHRDEREELADACAAYWQIEARKKLLEQEIRSIEADLKTRAGQLQRCMGDHHRVMAPGGWTMRWVHKKRAAYTVAAREWEQWQLRSPYG